MSKRIILGTHGGHDIGFDLDLLLATRLLIQAGSGGGKSWALRRLMEQAFGRVQIICIDPEGEFSTMRERFPFVLAGKGGEATVDPRAAGLLAERLLELKASAICDIYELKSHQRHAFVKNFLEALINAPKNLWHPALVIVDEAHVFAPEKGQGESEAYSGMVDLATRGRKRGFAAIFATQRLGKLSKNVSAELQNRLIGPTFEDIDRKRAAELLGVTKADEREFMHNLQVSEPGHFYALGRAISLERIKIDVGAVETTHPEIGKGKLQQHEPPTPDAIKELLPQLADLPKEAEQKAKTVADLQAEITKLRREVTMANRQAPTPDPRTIENAVAAALNKQAADANAKIRAAEQSATHLREALQRVSTVTAMALRDGAPAETAKVEMVTAPRPVIQPRPVPRPAPAREPRSYGPGEKLPKAERKILTALAQYQDGRTKIQTALLTAYAHGGGGFCNAVSALRSKGFIEGDGLLRATGAGLDALGDFTPLPMGDELLQHWYRTLGKAERSVLEALAGIWPESATKESIAEATGYAADGGGFNNALSRLRTLELISGRGELKASDDLFGECA